MDLRRSSGVSVGVALILSVSAYRAGGPAAQSPSLDQDSGEEVVVAGLAAGPGSAKRALRSDTCVAPPEIRRIASRPMREPAPGEFNTGTFRLIGRNFQDGDVFIDGPLVVVDPPGVNRPGTLIEKNWIIGCCAPTPGPFTVFVVTPCGQDEIEFEISGVDFPG